MSDSILTPERILDVAEDVLRRYGPAKATVVDVANALGVSHGTVYRHFPSKAALRDAVAARWLNRVTESLEAIITADEPAIVRLRQWLDQLITTKQSRAFDDPELFATYMALTMEAREVVQDHVDHLVVHIARIIEDGVARGEIVSANPQATARAVLDATTRFHKPSHAAEWRDPATKDAFENVWLLIVSGLTPRN